MNLRVFVIIGVVVILQGCFVFNETSEVDERIPVKTPYLTPHLLQFELPFTSYSLEDDFLDSEDQVTLQLLKQGRYYANLKEPYRLKACKELATAYKKNTFWQAGWLLAYSFSDKGSCITHKERLAILHELEGLIGFYKSIKWLNSAQIQTLKHITYLKDRNAFLKEKESLLKAQLKKSDTENIKLKTLIKELKKVEKIMNERLSDDSL